MQGRVKLPCMQCMHLLVPRSVVGLLCRGSCLSLWWQHSLLVPWGPGLLCKNVRMSYSSLVLFSVWHLSIVIDGCASSDRSPGPMLVKIRYISCLGFILVFHVGWCHAGSLCCVCVSHNVCVMLGSSLVFLAFCYVMMGRKSYHVYFITTSSTTHTLAF